MGREVERRQQLWFQIWVLVSIPPPPPPPPARAASVSLAVRWMQTVLRNPEQGFGVASGIMGRKKAGHT